jgi:tellurite resistance protein TerB
MKFLADARAKMALEVAKFKNEKFMDAVCAACAMIAVADGTIDPVEKQKMMGFMQHSDELSVFDFDKVTSSFSAIAKKFEFDMGIGKAEALKVISRVKDKPEQARMVVRVAIAIGGSDGNFDEHEKAAVRAICTELGLDPAEFDV